ncbi:deoxynucleoside kinase [Rhizobium sp.]|uniref:deoxynucleoside kinase n=1 Tax=Rhizobium sp. TaxID=391 RepID=UPI00289FC2AD
MPKIIAVSGGIAVGKTTFGNRIGHELQGAYFVQENPEQNPFLEDFYKDRTRWSFHSRIGMLDLFEQRMKAIPGDIDVIVLDRTIHELIVFADLQLRNGTMSQKEYDLYKSVFETYCTLMPVPDILIRVTCDEEVALERMHSRGRSFEQKIGLEYLRAVEKEYDRWFAGLTLRSTIITVRTDREIDLRDLLTQVGGGSLDK